MAAEEYIKVKYVNTKFNLADLFTKAVPKEVMEALEPYLCGTYSLDELLRRAEADTQKKKDEHAKSNS